MTKVLRQALAYILVLLIIGACLGLALLLHPILQGQSFLFFVVGVMLCSVIDGLTTGLFAAIVAAICHSYFFQFPRYSLAIENTQDLFELVIFCVLAITVNWFSVSLIRAKKNALAALENEKATSQFKDQILAAVAHDLRTPLTSIQICSHLIGAPETNAAAKSQAQQVILHSVQQMNVLIGDLVDANRIKYRRMSINPKLESVDALLKMAVEGFAPLADKKKITLKLNLADGLMVSCDRLRILQVLSNIVGNAIKFSPKLAIISISAQPRCEKVEFTIADTGPGIAPRDLPHIFEMFWQRPDSMNPGIGLGLAIAKSIVESHGEKIEVFSKPGQGTRFVFTLPAPTQATLPSLRAAS